MERTRPSAKREVQKERSSKRDDRIACPRRAQTCERSELRAMRMCPRSGQIFFIMEVQLFPIFDRKSYKYGPPMVIWLERKYDFSIVFCKLNILF